MGEVPAIIDHWPNAALYRYMGRVCRHLARGLHYQDPDDLLHDAVLKLSQTSRRGHAGRCSPTRLAFCCCRWTQTQLFQKLRRRPGDFLHPDPIDPEAGVEPADNRCPKPVETVVRREESERVSVLVAALPAADREVLTRRYGLGGSEPESLRSLAGGHTRQTGEQRVRKAEARLVIVLAGRHRALM